MVERSGVELHMNVQVTPEMVLNASPDVVIIATGGIPLTIPFPGLEETNWLLAADLLDGMAQVNTTTAFVIGGRLVGLESADYLSARGVQVTLVEMLPEVGAEMDVLAKGMLLGRLKKQGVAMHTRTRVTGLTKHNALVDKDGSPVRFPIETVIMAVGVRPDRSLAEALEGNGLEIHVIGDAFKTRKALEAIREGTEIGLEL